MCTQPVRQPQNDRCGHDQGWVREAAWSQLDDAILFDSGRAKLKQTAKTRSPAPSRSTTSSDWIVAGHTDNVPIKTTTYGGNWEASSARALEVVNFMIERVPAGTSARRAAEFDPVADNSTPEGRAQNRRIEIMMMPTIPQNLQDMLTKG
jgi:chemotaxis protein MotB